ncbi:MAG: DUF2461 domain-containing protein, partial [Betaproteobacteria bacterium]|nr:DUF2461 domain-containing protein [Betaproteobacteria bacterium]
QRLLRDKGLQTVFGGLVEKDKLIRLPKGFEADVPHPEFLKLRSYMVRREVNVKKLSPEKLPDLLLADFKASAPLVKWLRAAGPTP